MKIVLSLFLRSDFVLSEKTLFEFISIVFPHKNISSDFAVISSLNLPFNMNLYILGVLS